MPNTKESTQGYHPHTEGLVETFNDTLTLACPMKIVTGSEKTRHIVNSMKFGTFE